MTLSPPHEKPTRDALPTLSGGGSVRGKNTLNGTFNLRNTGTADAPASTIFLFLSNNRLLDEGDTLIAITSVGSVAAGGTKGVNVKVVLPAGANLAGQFLIAVVDATEAVLESDKGNNVIASGAITQTAGNKREGGKAKKQKR